MEGVTCSRSSTASTKSIEHLPCIEAVCLENFQGSNRDQNRIFKTGSKVIGMQTWRELCVPTVVVFSEPMIYVREAGTYPPDFGVIVDNGIPIFVRTW